MNPNLGSTSAWVTEREPGARRGSLRRWWRHIATRTGSAQCAPTQVIVSETDRVDRVGCMRIEEADGREGLYEHPGNNMLYINIILQIHSEVLSLDERRNYCPAKKRHLPPT